MASTIGFTIEIEGDEQALRTATELQKAIKDVNAELKKTEDVNEYKRLEKDLLGLQTELKEVRAQQRETVTALTSTLDGVGAYRKLSAELNTVRARAKDLQAQAILTGRDLSKEIEEATREAQRLDTQLKNIDASVGQFQRNVGNYPTTVTAILQGAGGAVDKLTGGFTNLGGVAGSAAGLASQGWIALATVLLEGINIIADTTAEFLELQKVTSTLTGATGDGLDEIVGKTKAVADTFNTDYKEVLLAANAVSKEFGITTTAALDVIGSGFANGADLAGDFLDQLREYPTQFAQAGLTAQQFVNVLTTATEEGIFSDKGADVVKEFGLRIREQTKATTDALNAAFGKEFTQDLFNNLNNGSITTADALAKVSTALNTTGLTAKQTQTVIADVFGGAGEDVGLRFLQSLGDINKGLDDTNENLTEYEQRQLEALKANEELAIAQSNLARSFQATADSSKSFVTQLKTAFFNFASNVVSAFSVIPSVFAGISASLQQIGQNITSFFKTVELDLRIFALQAEKLNPLGRTNEQIQKDIESLRGQRNELQTAGRSVGDAFSQGFAESLNARGLKIENGRIVSRFEVKEATTSVRPTAQASAGASVSGATATVKADTEVQAAQQRVAILEELNKKVIALTVERVKKVQELNIREFALTAQEITAFNERQAQLAQLQREAEAKKVTTTLDAFNTATQLFNDFQNALVARESEQTATRIEEQENYVMQLEQRLERATGANRRNLETQLADARRVLAEQTEARDKAIREQAKREKAVAIIQSIVNTALAVTRALATGNIVTAIGAGITGAAQTAIIAAQPLARGGIVQPVQLADGQILATSNIPTQKNGDNVLATVRTGEVVLNKRQQNLLGGVSTFRAIGVPGFESGGIVGVPNIASSSGSILDLVSKLDKKTDAINARLDRMRVFIVSDDIERDKTEREVVSKRAVLQ